MWFILLAIIVIAIVILAKNAGEKAKQERINQEKRERERKVANQAKVTKEKHEIITEEEKQLFIKDEGEAHLQKILTTFKDASSGNSDACYTLGLAYFTIKKSAKSAYWMQKATNTGSLESQSWLGEYYLNGYGVNENRVKGTNLILEAAKKGNKRAIKILREDFHMSTEKMRGIGIPI